MDLSSLSFAEHLAFTLQLVLGAVFAVAAVSKLRSPRAFAATVAQYAIVPARAAAWAAATVVGLEILVALALLGGRLVVIVVPLALATLSAFAVAVGVNLSRGRVIACGCFSSLGEQISGRSLVRLAGLAAAALAVLVLVAAGAEPMQPDQLAAAGRDGLVYGFEIATLAASVVTAGSWLLLSPELLALVRGGPAPGGARPTQLMGR